MKAESFLNVSPKHTEYAFSSGLLMHNIHHWLKDRSKAGYFLCVRKYWCSSFSPRDRLLGRFFTHCWTFPYKMKQFRFLFFFFFCISYQFSLFSLYRFFHFCPLWLINKCKKHESTNTSRLHKAGTNPESIIWNLQWIVKWGPPHSSQVFFHSDLGTDSKDSSSPLLTLLFCSVEWEPHCWSYEPQIGCGVHVAHKAVNALP